jgi:hypothetical protein
MRNAATQLSVQSSSWWVEVKAAVGGAFDMAAGYGQGD